MASTFLRGRRPERFLALLPFLLILTGFTAGSAVSADKEPGKPAATEARPGANPSKDSSVPEMVQLINEKLASQWQENKIKPSEPATDHEFIRRASLDLIGRIAKPEEISKFLSDPAATRRALLIDRLLQSDEYPRHWANLWANWLLTRAGLFGHGTMYHDQMQVWLEDQFAQFRPFDKMVIELLTASGENTKNGAVNFVLAHLGEANPQGKRGEDGEFEVIPITSRTTRLFLGVQTQCTQCHDHPFDAQLKQQHFWGVNAFFRQVERKGRVAMQRQDTPGPLTLVDNVNNNTEGFVNFEKRNGVIMITKPAFFDDRNVKVDLKGNRRAQLAELIVNHENFPKAFVNRMWAHFYGRGFTHPVDDFNEQNQPTNPELLDELAKKFKHYGYDQRKLIRWICNSQVYNLSSVANKTNDKPDAEPFFSRMLLKAMSPEQLFESLMVATQAEGGQTKEGRRSLRKRWLDKLVANFGDDEGNEVSFNGTVVQALLLMNGDDINQAITGPKAAVAQMMARPGTSGGYIQHLFLATLNRPPTQREVSTILSKMPMKVADRDRAAVWHDMLWALVNSNEFILNH